MCRQPHHRNGAFVVGFSIGVAIGAALGVTYAPRAGRESRRRVVDAVRQWPNSVATQYDRAADGIQTGMEQAKSAVTAVAGGLSDALEEAKTRVVDAIQRGAEEARADIRESDAAADRDVETADTLAVDLKNRS